MIAKAKGRGLFVHQKLEPQRDVAAYLRGLRSHAEQLAAHLAGLERDLSGTFLYVDSARLAADTRDRLAMLRMLLRQPEQDATACVCAAILVIERYRELHANEHWGPAVNSRRASTAAHRVNMQKGNKESEIRADHAALVGFYEWLAKNENKYSVTTPETEKLAKYLKTKRYSITTRTRKRLKRMLK